jgi:hypothetical protein
MGVHYRARNRAWKPFTHRSWRRLLVLSEVPLSCKSTCATLRLVFPTLALAVFFGAAPLYAQCPGHQPPAGSVLVTQNSGTFTAPGNGKFAYSPFPIDLTRFPSGGTLTIAATVGNGTAKASFQVWPGNAVMMADGTPSDSLSVTADPANADGTPGSCVTLVYRFLQPQAVVFGVTGGWFQAVGATNTFDFSAYVQPTGGRIAPAASTGTNSPVTSTLIQSVWIQNAPSVPDTGGHSILGGILRGNLSAVEPNLVICVTPTGTSGGRRTCTDICPPGHYCQKEFGGGVRLNGANPSVHVEVLDDDKQGKISQLAAFDENDARKCLPDQPCMVDTTESIPMSVSFGFGGPEGCVAPTSVSGTGSTLSSSTSVTVSTPAPTTAPKSTTTAPSSSLQAILGQAFEAESAAGKPTTTTSTSASGAMMLTLGVPESAFLPTPPGIPDLKPPGERGCCALGWAQALDYRILNQKHDYGNSAVPSDMVAYTAVNVGEPVGYVYTAKAGLVDIGHVRDNADMTFWVYNQLANGNRSLTVHPDQAWVSAIPCTQGEMLLLAGAIVYVNSWGHELGTWGETTGVSWLDKLVVVPVYNKLSALGLVEKKSALTPEDFSAFSPEDLPSNLVGIQVATVAIENGGYASVQDFDKQVNSVLPALLQDLGAESQQATEIVLDKTKLAPGDTVLTNKWFMDDKTSANAHVDLLRRNFDAKPWPAPGTKVDRPEWLTPQRFVRYYSQFFYLMTTVVDATQVPNTAQFVRNREKSLGWTPIDSQTVPRVSGPIKNAQGDLTVMPAIYEGEGNQLTSGQFANVLVQTEAGLPDVFLARMDKATAAIDDAFSKQNPGQNGP